MEWQPISTAPKDGTRVKLLIPYDRDRFSEAECTDEGRWSKDEYDFDFETQELVARGCWRFDGDDGPFDLQPTHWMPLPQPPETDD